MQPSTLNCLIVRFCSFSMICFAFLLFPFWAKAQAPMPTLENPYNSMYVHLYYLQVESYNPSIAAQTLNTTDFAKKEQLAIQLKQVLDGKGLYVHLNVLPQEADYTDSLTHRHYYTPFPAELPEVYLEKINSKWLYSKETVAQIPRLHRNVYPFGSDVLLKILPKMGQTKIMGLALWQYLGFALLVLTLFILHLLLSRLLRPIISKISHTHNRYAEGDDVLIRKIARLSSLLVLFYAFMALLPVLQLPPFLSGYVVLGVRIILSVFVILFFLRLIDLISLYASKFTKNTASRMDEQVLPIARRSLQIIVVLGVGIHILRLLDVNVTALIAGISIGGLALALAAQDTVKNLIGSIMIFVDRPFQIGDYIEWGSHAGTVVEVGFRTTRIQLSDSSIISVPNGTIANVAVTNKGVRIFRLFNIKLGVIYSTKPALINQFTEGLKQIILEHSDTAKENYYVHLSELSASSLDILFRVPILVSDYANELKVKEELLLSILHLAEDLGIGFAFPSTSIYMEESEKIPTK